MPETVDGARRKTNTSWMTSGVVLMNSMTKCKVGPKTGSRLRMAMPRPSTRAIK